MIRASPILVMMSRRSRIKRVHHFYCLHDSSISLPPVSGSTPPPTPNPWDQYQRPSEISILFPTHQGLHQHWLDGYGSVLYLTIFYINFHGPFPMAYLVLQKWIKVTPTLLLVILVIIIRPLYFSCVGPVRYNPSALVMSMCWCCVPHPPDPPTPPDNHYITRGYPVTLHKGPLHPLNIPNAQPSP